ncbi:MAG: SHOCT domain-containing protein [Gaiellaceae bacterium]
MTMFRARRRPLMRAAMVGGTAYYAGKAGQRAASRQEQEYSQEQDQEARLANLEAQTAPQPAAPPATDMVGRLNQLGQLHASGVLTDAEFAAAKQQLLAS